MADGEEVTLDGRPLQALRVADLKEALEQRGLSKSGAKNTLIKRLRGALMLENLQKHSTPHTTFQPNSQIGEEMSQNSIIKQYLEKQQELLRQRLEREAREAADLESKTCVISRKREEEEEESRKPEEHLSRVRQARAVKTAGGSHALVSEERETSLRSRRAAQRLPVKEEEEEEEEEEEDAPPLLVGQTPMRPEEPGMPAPQETGMFQASLPIVLQAQQTEARSRRPDSPSCEAAMPVLAHLQRSEDEEEEAQPRATLPGDKQQAALSPGETPEAPKKESLPATPKEEAAPQLPEALKMETEQELGLLEEPRSTGLSEIPQEKEKEKEVVMEQAETPDVGLQKEGEPQREETPEGAASQALRSLEEEASAAAAALVQASPSPPQLIDAQQAQQDPRGDEPPPPLLTKETPAGLGPAEDEAPPQLSQPSPPAQEAPAGASLGASPSPLALPSQQPIRPGSSRSSSSSSSSSSRSRSHSPGGSPPRSRARRPRSASSESPARKRPVLGSPSCSGSEWRSSSRSRSRSRSSSRGSSGGSSQSRSCEASRDSTSFPPTKGFSPSGPWSPPDCLKAQYRETPSSPREEGRRAPTPPPDPQKQRSPSPPQQQPAAHSVETESTIPERGSPEPPFPAEGSGLESGGPASEPQRPAEPLRSETEEKQTVPMELSEPHPENEALEPGGPEDQPSADPAGPEAGPEDEEKKEGSAQPKAFKRKISVVSASSVAKGAVATNSDTEGSQPAGRKRRWGASTATTQKKPSISITTESLKSLIPEIKPPPGGQEAVVELHADDSRISEDEAERHLEEPAHEKALKICRTVTQVVPVEGQENGQGEEEEEEEEEEEKVHEEEQPEAAPVVAVETVVLPLPVEHEVKKVTLSDTLTRRSISQQRSGVSITIDDPVRTAQVPSPPRGKVSCIVHICNLVRPFTLGQLKELLGRTGTLVEEAFWIDKIKSHCYVTYSTVEEAVATRNALHGVKWPQSNPKFLSADFVEQDELDFHRGLLTDRPVEAKADEVPTFPGAGPTPRGERELSRRSEAREREAAVREQWAEREREMERRERTLAEREWDRDKVREGPRSRSRSRERRRKERPKSKEKKAEKKEKAQEEPPAKLLDDLFRKTKAAPCIYWLPLTDIQCVQKQAERAARARERERRRKELEAEEARQRERNRQAERDKRREHSRERERERPNATSGGGANRAGERSGRGGDRERREAKSRHSRSRSRSTPVQDRGGRR